MGGERRLDRIALGAVARSQVRRERGQFGGGLPMLVEYASRLGDVESASHDSQLSLWWCKNGDQIAEG
jgi:hypothetical protein